MNNPINFGEYKWIKGKTGNNNNSLGSHPIMKNCFVLWHKIFLEFTKQLMAVKHGKRYYISTTKPVAVTWLWNRVTLLFFMLVPGG